MNNGWSDGRERADEYGGDSLSVAIVEYFATTREEELLRLRWDNEYMRRQLRDREEEEINAAVLAMKAGVGR